jgi:hypothetical protein
MGVTGRLETGERGRPSCARTLHFEKEDEDLIYGGMFTTDNINHVAQPLNVNSKIGPKLLNMTSNAFVRNRIPQKPSEFEGKRKYEQATDVPMTAFFPTQEDTELIKADQLILIRRILVKHLTIFHSVANHPCVNWYIQHQFSKESAKQSNFQSMGILDINQTTTDGTKKILSYLLKYFPKKPDGSPLNLVVGGDVLSVKMMSCTRNHLCNAEKEDENLEGPVPSVGQFHLRVRSNDIFYTLRYCLFH